MLKFAKSPVYIPDPARPWLLYLTPSHLSAHQMAVWRFREGDDTDV